MIDSLFLSLLSSKTNKKKNVYIFLLFEESKVEQSMNKLNFNIPEEVLHDFTGQEKQIMNYYHDNQLIVLAGLGKKKELTKENSDFIFQNLKNYVNFIEEYLNLPIKIVSLGPERNQTILR